MAAIIAANYSHTNSIAACRFDQSWNEMNEKKSNFYMFNAYVN
jgi:hypothetical protein